MSNELDLTQWIDKLKDGEEEAAQAIWDAYFPRICGLARKRLGDIKKRTFDEEDLALSAINALCAGAKEGKFERLESRDDLWQILAMITSRKAANSWRKQNRRDEMGESVLAPRSNDEFGNALETIGDANLADSLAGTCSELLGLLDDKLRDVAYCRLQGFSNAEIADRLNRSEKSVERYMKLIREKWSPYLQNTAG